MSPLTKDLISAGFIPGFTTFAWPPSPQAVLVLADRSQRLETRKGSGGWVSENDPHHIRRTSDIKRTDGSIIAPKLTDIGMSALALQNPCSLYFLTPTLSKDVFSWPAFGLKIKLKEVFPFLVHMRFPFSLGLHQDICHYHSTNGGISSWSSYSG